MKTFLIHYTEIGHKYPISFYKVRAKNEATAIQKAIQLYISDWYEGVEEGKKQAETLNFTNSGY